MDDKLYIPKLIHAGFVKRDGTFSGRLSYIIFTDDKGKKRKETSWEGWRDKKIPAEDYKNEPTSGFVLNKGVQRSNWNHFSSGRSLIRVYDPRGLEFEITPDNLLFILQHTDCVKRELVGEFVYSWSGKDLILLPKDTEDYRLSSDFTKLQSQKISARDLVVGVSYKTKQQEDVIYVGRHMWYELDYYHDKDRLGKKYHIFTQDNGKTFITKSSVEFLAAKNNDEIVDNIADIVEKFNKNIHSSKIVKFEAVPAEVDFTPTHPEHSHMDYLKNNEYFMFKDGVIANITLSQVKESKNVDGKYEYQLKGYKYSSYRGLDINTQKFVGSGYSSNYVYKGQKKSLNSNYWNSHSYDQIPFTEEDILGLGLSYIYITLENGRRVKMKSFNDL